MHTKLATALSNLDISKNDAATSKEHAEALFEYLYIAGYLSSDLIQKAVEHLSLAHPFAHDKKVVIQDLTRALNNAAKSGSMNTEIFTDQFANQDYFTIADIVDLITFLQQTAFDRQHGVERDKLQAKPWMEEHADKFITLARKLGVIDEKNPKAKHYIGIGIMGGATIRVIPRLTYFNQLKSVAFDAVWALSGNRELSKGLDGDEEMKAIAKSLNKPLKFVTKPAGNTTREFLDGVTETQMVNYFIQKLCSSEKFGIVDSQEQEGHWRVTTSQNATDIALIILKKIQNDEVTQDKSGIYRFMIIADQPYTSRMAKQVQRAFNKEIKKQNLDIKVNIEGCGPGVDSNVIQNPSKHLDVLTGINSALGALIAERFIDAREQNPTLAKRQSDIIMFSKRDDFYKTLLEENKSTFKKPYI